MGATPPKPLNSINLMLFSNFIYFDELTKPLNWMNLLFSLILFNYMGAQPELDQLAAFLGFNLVRVALLPNPRKTEPETGMDIGQPY